MASTVDPLDLTPQPGAVYSEEGFIANGLGPTIDIVHEGWPDLPGSQATNSISVEPWELTIPTVSSPAPSRVWSDPAWDIGRYWSEVSAQTANQFYGDFAVEYQWNGGLYQATLKALPAGVKSIKVWKGPTARQPAMLLDPSGSGRVIGTPMYWVLPGGGQLNQHLSSAATNADAKAQATLMLWSLVATGRHVDGDFSFSGQQEAVDQAITDVVAAAYALAQGSTHQEV